MPIKIAFAYEGPAEKETVEILLKRLFGEISFEILESKSPRTGLIGFLPSYIERFKSLNADLYIFFTDLDGDMEREKTIAEILKKYPTEVDKVVLALSSQNFEGWLLGDQDVVKNLFNFSQTDPLPYQNITDPKKRLEKYQREMNEGEQITLFDARVQLVTNMNLDNLSFRCGDFAKFRNNLLEKIKKLSRSY